MSELLSAIESVTRLFGGVELIVEPALEGAKRRWLPLDAHCIAVAPSLFEEIKNLVPEAKR